jgi:predicted Zn-dependent peptidase
MDSFPLVVDKLATGLPTVMLPTHEGQTVTFLVLIGVGSRYESPRQWGLSHFLEHMFFKGTQKRPDTKQIAEAIDNVGGEFNAFTGEEYTGYYVKVASEYLERGADVVADILLQPLFPAVEIERERGVITEEIRMYTDTPMRHVWHLWSQALFGDHPLGRRIDGTPETVASFKRADFLRYTKQHYHTGNAVVTVAGRCDQVATKKLLAQLFASLPQGGATHPRPAPKRVPFQRVVAESRRSLDQTHLLVGAPGLSLHDDQRWAAEVLATILGAGMSSRLFIAVRERRGLAYAVRTSADSYTDAGSFVTQAGVRTDSALQALEVILDEYARIRNELVPPAELTKAKQMLRGRLLLELEETNALALFAGMQQLLRGTIETPATVREKIEGVTAEEVQAVAQRILDPASLALALLGPQRHVKPFERLLDRQ